MPFIIPFLLLSACSDYNMVAQTADLSLNASNSDVDGDEPETNVEDVEVDDTGLEPDGECGFHLQSGPMDEVFTMSYPTYELQTPEVDFLQPGDPLQLWYGITADLCGDIEVIVLQYAINDEASWDEWLMPVIREEAYMRDPSDEFVFDATAAYAATSNELRFAWSDGSSWELGNDNTGEMDTVLIEAGETKWFVYDFLDTELAPIDTIADLMLSTIIWRDVGTEQEVQGWNDGHDDIWSTVQFVE